MNSPYFLIPISVAITLFYLLGRILVQAGITSITTHRKFWNFVLLFVFLGCSVLGILLTVNINYKLEWDFIKTLLAWHVQLGIAMSVVALIHTLWHSSYFSKYLSIKRFKIFRNERHNKNQPLIAAFALGVLSVSLQVLLIRQFTKVFQGNEFLITWTIGIWMILSGVGAYLGSRSTINLNETNKVVVNALWFMYFSAVLFIFLSGEIKQTFFPSGVLIPPHYIILMVTLMMATTAIPSGLTYALLTNQVKSKYPTIYAFEALGSLFGGLLLSLVIIWFLNTYLAAISIGVIAGIILAYPYNKAGRIIIPILILAIGVSIKIFNADIYAESILLPGQNILSVSDSPYGSLTVTGSEDQINFFENGSLRFSTQNTIYCEETIHYIMAQRPNPQKVLLISGGYTGLISELEKYSHAEIDYIEPNPHILKLSQRFCRQTSLQNINIIKGNARNYLRESKSSYDIAIIASAEPTSIVQNQHFTLEFLMLAKKHLKPSGVIGFNLNGIGNYPSAPKLRAYASIATTLKKAFKNVEVITGERDYLLASDSAIRIDMAQLLSERHIGDSNLYVRPDYINDEHIVQRNQFFHEQTSTPQKLNTDNHPWPILQSTIGYLSMFGNRLWLLFSIGMGVLIIPIAFLKRSTRSMYVIGFAGAAIQSLYLLTLQVDAGILYGALGAMIAIFMGGLAGGSLLNDKSKKVKPFHSKILLIVSFILLISLWQFMLGIPIWLTIAILCLGTLMASFAVGYLYVNITGNDLSELQPAKTYAADLLGSATGVVIVTLLLVPSVGFIATATILGIGVSLYLVLSKL